MQDAIAGRGMERAVRVGPQVRDTMWMREMSNLVLMLVGFGVLLALLCSQG